MATKTTEKPAKAPSASASAPYTTLTEIRHDGKDVPVGGTIDLSPKQAEQLVALGAIKPK